MSILIRKILIISAVIQGLISVAYFIWTNFFPTENCRVYGDCAGEGLTIFLIVIPFAIMALLHLVFAFIKTQSQFWKWLIMAWLILSWLYAGYWIFWMVLIFVPL